MSTQSASAWLLAVSSIVRARSARSLTIAACAYNREGVESGVPCRPSVVCQGEAGEAEGPGRPVGGDDLCPIADLAEGRVGRHPAMADQVVEHGPDVDGAGGHVRTWAEGEGGVSPGCPEGPGLPAEPNAGGDHGAGRPLGLVVSPVHHLAV